MLKPLLFALFLSLIPGRQLIVSPQNKPTEIPHAGTAKIQIALLLDTSNSMDGLIEQAKSQLWKMVNRLADAQRQNEGVELEIALYEYGNDGLSGREGYIRMVQPLKNDLDGLSEQLFQLKTYGGSEYCGWVMETALAQLSWSDSPDDLRVIVIAGNEPFNQGPKDYRKICVQAADRGLVINTVFCGDYEEGIKTFWKNGAECTKGRYMNIDTDERVVHIPTPYDSTVLILNENLNKTYFGYGRKGEAMKSRQTMQDKNAASFGTANQVQRASAKAKKTYSNADWDLVDAVEEDEAVLEKLEKEDLPEAWRNKSPEELKATIEQLKTERSAIRKELLDLEKKIDVYQAAERKKMSDTQTLDNVLIEAVVDQAKAKGFAFPE